ncbi:hypothetical protein AYJ54_02100 [Bradyrhizobium centrolobii]|uniref:Uncharacterized protein n=1 Tax=Bradyrhizobium centrolobii TaxID=1505087 RepID=A0A176YGE7_9BRAD|nr:hypothetical protein AYJ54_02100 [Bradyrhizobium centrolobii]
MPVCGAGPVFRAKAEPQMSVSAATARTLSMEASFTQDYLRAAELFHLRISFPSVGPSAPHETTATKESHPAHRRLTFDRLA